MPFLPEILQAGSVESGRFALEQLLLTWVPQRRWFRSKSKTPTSIEVESHATLGTAVNGPSLCIVRVQLNDGTQERYLLPLFLADADQAASLPEAAQVGRLEIQGSPTVADASWDPRFRKALFDLMAAKDEVALQPGRNADSNPGTLQGLPNASLGLRDGAVESSGVLSAEQSNTAFFYTLTDGTGLFVKLYRRLEEAINPEPEMLRFLEVHTEFRHVPRYASSLEWRADSQRSRPPITLGLMQQRVLARGDAWEYALKCLATPAENPDFEAWVSLLGQRVAEFHAALSSAPVGHPFAPETLTPADLERVGEGARAMLADALSTLQERYGEASVDGSRNTPAELRMLVAEIVARREDLERLLRVVGATRGVLKTRTHGDLHLGQVLVGEQSALDLWILDFEGEPGRPLTEARRKQSPLRDVAGMLRSFHYAAHTAARMGGDPDADGSARRLGAAFRSGYEKESDSSDKNAQNGILDLFIIEKAIYELHYELNNRPDWVEIPLRGLLEIARHAASR